MGLLAGRSNLNVIDTAFPRTLHYAGLHSASDEVREPRPLESRFPATERHLQCIWFDPAFRPTDLLTAFGERVFVEHPGIWNLEAGPDFLGAALRVGSEQRRIQGDVEVHIHPSGWQQHGLATDSRYRNVRCHVTYFRGRAPEGTLPAGTVEIGLVDALTRDPVFSFDAIDVTAYPYAARAQSPPCSDALRTWVPQARQALLDAAGEERLRRKAVRVAGRIAVTGTAQTLYEEVLAALGFKHNKLSFRRLATALPVDALREGAGSDPLAGYALLAGVSGLLPERMRPTWDDETRSFVRLVWDQWWKVRETWAPASLDRSEWKLSGLRPANHPLRRMAAAAHLFTREEPMEDTWQKDSASGYEVARASLSQPTDPYWSHRLGLGGKPHPKPVALIGPARVHAILTNVFIPFAAARSAPRVDLARWLDRLPLDEDNDVVRRTAHFLFGPDHSPSLYATGLRRQGLIQVFHDYCLIDRSRCATCTFPDALRRHARRDSGGR